MNRAFVRFPWRAAAVALLALCLGQFVVPVAADDSQGARDVVRKITDQVIEVLQDKEISADEKRRRIETIVYEHLDFETMSRLVLARNWRDLSEMKRLEFIAEFRQHLSVTYGSNVENYQDERVTISGDREEARGDWTVKTQIVRNGPNDIFVDYRLRQSDAGWKIIDVIIERVSLISNFRSQFQDILANGGIERVLELLRKKNAEGTSGLKS